MYNEYLKEYVSNNYEQYNLKLNKVKDKDIIDFFNKTKISKRSLIISLLRDYINKQ